MAMCVIAVVGVAPCQCFSPGANQTTSPGRIFSIGVALALNPAKTGRDNQRLTEWMCMPGSASTRLEGDACATNASRFGCLEQRINANRAGEPIGWSFGGTLRTTSFYLHLRPPIFHLLSARRSLRRAPT